MRDAIISYTPEYVQNNELASQLATEYSTPRIYCVVRGIDVWLKTA